MRVLILSLLAPTLAFAQAWPLGGDNSFPPDQPPPNNAPVWNSTPAPVFTEGVADSQLWSQWVSDADGDTITMTNGVGCTLPTGVSLNNINYSLDADTNTTAGTTTGCVMIAYDGTDTTNSPAYTITIQGTGQGSSGDFPRLGLSAIGGWGVPSWSKRPGGFDGRMARMAAHDVVIINVWRTWACPSGTCGNGHDTSTIAAHLKSLNPNIKVYNYTNPSDAPTSRQENIEPYMTFANDGSPATGGKGTDEGWWLYDGTGTTYPSDVMFASGPFPDPQINVGDTSTDSAGLTVAEWFARAFQAASTDSGDWVTPGYGFGSANNFDGTYMDIHRYEYRTDGDYDDDSVLEQKEGTTSVTYRKNGFDRWHNEWTSLEGASFLHCGNYTQNYGTGGGSAAIDQFATAISAGYRNYINCGFSEAAMGRSSSVESWGGWDQMMRRYKRAMYMHDQMDPQHVLWDNWLADGFSESDPGIQDGIMSDAAWCRYGLATTLQDNGYYGCPTSGGFVDNYDLDEFYYNLGVAIDEPAYDGDSPETDVTGSGYLAYESGVYLRKFQFGAAIVNPKDNGQQTITLPSEAGFHWDRLGSSDFPGRTLQEPSVNTGATDITSVTIDARRGLIIRRHSGGSH